MWRLSRTEQSLFSILIIDMSDSPLDTMSARARALLADLVNRVDTPSDWAERYANALDPTHPVQLHLAIFVEPFLSWVIDGTKTVESRFSSVRCAPWDAVKENDVVLMKQSSGPVVGTFIVGFVSSYRITGGDLDDIRCLFGDSIRAEDDEFWANRSGAKYATLMGIAAHHRIQPTPIPKRDRRGWVVIGGDRSNQSSPIDV